MHAQEEDKAQTHRYYEGGDKPKDENSHSEELFSSEELQRADYYRDQKDDYSLLIYFILNQLAEVGWAKFRGF